MRARPRSSHGRHLARDVDLAFRPTPWPRTAHIADPSSKASPGAPVRGCAPGELRAGRPLLFGPSPATESGSRCSRSTASGRLGACNAMDEVWTPSRWGRERFRERRHEADPRRPSGYDAARFRPEPSPAGELAVHVPLGLRVGRAERRRSCSRVRGGVLGYRRRPPVRVRTTHDGHVDVAKQIEGSASAQRPPSLALYNTHIRSEPARHAVSRRGRVRCRRAARDGACRSSRRWPAACR